MQVSPCGTSGKLYEMKQRYALKSTTSKNNIQSFMLLSNPLISTQLKTKYSDVMSHAVSSFLDHNPKDDKSITKSSISKQRLLIKQKEIFHVLNSSTKETYKTLLPPRRNHPIQQVNYFNSNTLTFKPNSVNMIKRGIRNSSMEDSSGTMIQRIKELSSTAHLPLNGNRNSLIKNQLGNEYMKRNYGGMVCSASMKNMRDYQNSCDNNVKNQLSSCEDRGNNRNKRVFNEQFLRNCQQKYTYERPLSDRKENINSSNYNHNNQPESLLCSTIMKNDNTNESSCEINIYNNLIGNYIN